MRAKSGSLDHDNGVGDHLSTVTRDDGPGNCPCLPSLRVRGTGDKQGQQ